MTNVEPKTVSRGQFLMNGAKGSLALVTAGGVLASVDGVALAKSGSLAKSDIAILQIGFIAETLAVDIYEAIVKTYDKKFHLGNLDYFKAALAEEKAHRAEWGALLGKRHRPTGFTVNVPKSAVASKKSLVQTGVTLEAAFVSTYIGAVEQFKSLELKVGAAAVAANEATHYSFLDAALGGNATLPAFPKPLAPAKAAAELKSLGFVG